MHSIIPAQSIDGYQLGWTYRQLLPLLPSNSFQIKDLADGFVLSYRYYKFWFESPHLELTQIGVFPDYKGNFMGVGLGNTLPDIEQKIGQWEESYCIYILADYQGIGFELADNDIDEEWIESEAPISAIYVFLPKED